MRTGLACGAKSGNLRGQETGLVRGHRRHWLCGDGRACRRGYPGPGELRRSAFGLLATVQSFGNLAASAIAGLLWIAASPRVAFAYLVAWMLLALAGLTTAR